MGLNDLEDELKTVVNGQKSFETVSGINKNLTKTIKELREELTKVQIELENEKRVYSELSKKHEEQTVQLLKECNITKELKKERKRIENELNKELEHERTIAKELKKDLKHFENVVKDLKELEADKEKRVRQIMKELENEQLKNKKLDDHKHRQLRQIKKELEDEQLKNKKLDDDKHRVKVDLEHVKVKLYQQIQKLQNRVDSLSMELHAERTDKELLIKRQQHEKLEKIERFENFLTNNQKQIAKDRKTALDRVVDLKELTHKDFEYFKAMFQNKTTHKRRCLYVPRNNPTVCKHATDKFVFCNEHFAEVLERFNNVDDIEKFLEYV